MKKSYISELSTDKLIKRRELFKGVVLGFIIIWLLVFGIGVYLYLNKSDGKLFFMLFPLSGTLLPLYVYLNSLKAEIKSRSSR